MIHSKTLLGLRCAWQPSWECAPIPSPSPAHRPISRPSGRDPGSRSLATLGCAVQQWGSEQIVHPVYLT
jgi:hypothetical protein